MSRQPRGNFILCCCVRGRGRAQGGRAQEERAAPARNCGERVTEARTKMRALLRKQRSWATRRGAQARLRKGRKTLRDLSCDAIHLFTTNNICEA